MNTIRQIRSSVVIVTACAAVAVTGSSATAIPGGDGGQPGPTHTEASPPPAPTPVVVPTFDTSTGAGQCFSWHGTWNTAEGPQPTCEASTTVLARPAPEIEDPVCAPVPDVRYVGIPWVAPEATGCASVDRWWDFVPA